MYLKLCQKRNLFAVCLCLQKKLPYQLLLTALLIIAVQSFSKTQLPTAVLDIVRREDARRIDCNG